MADPVPEKDDPIDRILDPRPQVASSQADNDIRATDPIAGALDPAPHSGELDAAAERQRAQNTKPRDPFDHVIDQVTGQESSD